MDGTTSPASERPPRRRSRCARWPGPGARTATIVGAGVQAREHLRLLPLVRPFTEIKIASLHPEDAERLAAASPIARAVRDIEEATAGADVVCLCTHSYDPVIETAWVSPGTHVTSVGYAPRAASCHRICRGVTPSTSRRRRPSRRRRSVAPSWPISPPRHGITLGDMLLGRKPGRISETQITSTRDGHRHGDMVAAHLVWERARASDAGTVAVI